MSIQEFHKAFKKNPGIDTFREFQINHDPDHKKCRECGDVIYYSGVDIRIKNGIVYRGSSYKSTKKNGSDIHNLQVCQSCLFEKFPEIINNKRIFNTDHEAALWAFGIEELLNPTKRAITLDNMIARYGEEEGTSKFNDYRLKQSYSNSFEYKKEKYGWTREQFDEFNQSRAVTLKNLIKKYGEDEGIFRFREYCERQSYTNTLEYYIEKYGKDDGTVRFYEYKRKMHQNYSDISQWLFKSIEDKMNIKCQYALRGGELYFSIEGIRGFFDFVIPDYKIVVEYDGDAIHANPKKYKDDDFCHPYSKTITAKQIREKDNSRDLVLKSNGYSIIRVWHSDYIKDPKKTTEKICHKIKELIKQKKCNQNLNP